MIHMMSFMFPPDVDEVLGWVGGRDVCGGVVLVGAVGAGDGDTVRLVGGLENEPFEAVYIGEVCVGECFVVSADLECCVELE